MQDTQFTIKLNKEESELIRKAAEISGIGHTSFSRFAALREARKILIENKII